MRASIVSAVALSFLILGLSLSLVIPPRNIGKMEVTHNPQARNYFELSLLIPPQNWNPFRHQELLTNGWLFTSYKNQRFTYLYEVDNLWTNVGMNRTVHKLLNPGANNTASGGFLYASFISIHTGLAAGTCAYTSTTLASEVTTGGGARGSGTFATGSASSGDITANQTRSFAITASFTNVNATGLWTASSAGLLFACGQFVNTSVVSGDTLQIRHVNQLTN